MAQPRIVNGVLWVTLGDPRPSDRAHDLLGPVVPLDALLNGHPCGRCMMQRAEEAGNGCQDDAEGRVRSL